MSRTTMSLSRFLPDAYTQILIGVVLLATLLPASGQGALAFEWITSLAIGLLFFLHGAKLSREAIIAGATHWRLHLLIFACTFVLFPLLGLALKPLLYPLLGNELYLGMLYLCALPATVQSAIAFTSLARGNIPAAICSAAASSLLGIFLTPLLVMLLMGVEGESGSTLDAIGAIEQRRGLQPAGHLPHPAAGHAADGRGGRKRLDPGRHRRDRVAAAGALRRRTTGPPADRRLAGPQWQLAAQGGSGLDSAGGLHRLQRGGDRWPVGADSAGSEERR